MDMREAFSLQEQRMVQNDKGDVSSEWHDVYRGYARVASLGSREYWEAAAVGAESTIKLFCRYHPALDSVDVRSARIVWRGRCLDISSIDNVNYQNEQTVIRAVMKNGR